MTGEIIIFIIINIIALFKPKLFSWTQVLSYCTEIKVDTENQSSRIQKLIWFDVI